MKINKKSKTHLLIIYFVAKEVKKKFLNIKYSAFYSHIFF